MKTTLDDETLLIIIPAERTKGRTNRYIHNQRLLTANEFEINLRVINHVDS